MTSFSDDALRSTEYVFVLLPEMKNGCNKLKWKKKKAINW